MNTIFLDSVNSTNSFAKEHCQEFDPHSVTCIIAQEQTAGRGRMNRKWHSPKGLNIYATFYFQLPLHALHLISIAHIMTLSVTTVLLQKNLQPQIKWPNDILIHQKKIAGVLCETAFHSDWVDIFLGVGINMNMKPHHLESIDQKATSLLLETNQPQNISDFIQKLQKQFSVDLQTFKQNGFTPFHAQFENLLAFKGETIRCFDGHREWVGICHSVTNDGQLNLFLPNHEIVTLRSGDLSYIK